MRIWIINHYAAPPAMMGGTRHYNFARQLIRRGHDVILLAANYNHFSHTFTDFETGKIDRSAEVPFLWVPTPAYHGNTISRFQNMLAFSWRVLQKKYIATLPAPDVIIGSSPHLFAAFSAELLARRFKVPFVLEIRDIWPESLTALGKISSYHPLIMLMKGVEKYLYRRADHVITLLPQANQYFIENGIHPDHISYLPNAMDGDAAPKNLEHAENLGFNFIYAGAHGLANDLDTVITAAKILQEKPLQKTLHIFLIGEGPEKLRLKKLAEDLNVNNVTFLDAVPKTEIYHVLNKANAFLMLLKKSPVFRWGISPNKLFDYLSMAKPVIFGVDTPFNPIEKFKAGLSIKPSDPEALASAMYHLSLLPQTELNEMGRRGKEFVVRDHNILSLTDTLEGLLKKTCAPV